MVFTFNRDKLSPFNCHHHIGHHITHLRIPSSFSVDLLYDMEVRVSRRSSLKTRPDVGFLFEGKNVSCRNRPLRLGEKSCDSSTIYRGIWKGIPPSEHKAAIKRVKKTDCMEHWEVVVDWHQRGTLNHSNVLKLFGFEEDTEWRYFALERFDATLEQFCNKQYTGPMPYDNQVLYQISKGLIYLHKKGLAHGNLTPKTILIANSDPVKMKLADFGLCQGIAADGTETTKPTIHSAELNDIIERDKNSELDPATASSGSKEELSHSKFWKRPEIIGSLRRSVSSSGSSRSVESTVPITKDISYSIPGATAEGDTFAAGCLFFYFIKRGLHPFGDAHSILNNIQEWKPVNIKELDEHHFAYKPILDLIGNSSIEGSQQYLIEAALKFRVGAFAVAWKMNMLKK